MDSNYPPVTAQLFDPMFTIPVRPVLPPSGKKCGEMVAVPDAGGLSFYVWDCTTNTWISIIYNGNNTPNLPVLPPSPPNGNNFITITIAGNSYTYVWNPVTNTWVQITNNNYVVYPAGPDVTTDDVGPIYFNDFTDTHQWAVIQNNATYAISFDATRKMIVSSVASAVNSTFKSWAGVLHRRRIAPNAAGIIDIGFSFDNILTSAAAGVDATHSFQLCGFFSPEIIGIPTYKIGGIKTTGFPNGSYQISWWSQWLAATDVSIQQVNMGTVVSSFSLRYQVKWILNAAGTSVGFQIDNTNATYAHNGGVPVAFGAALTANSMNNNIVASPPGYSWGFGLFSSLRDFPAAHDFGRLTQVVLYQGTLRGY